MSSYYLTFKSRPASYDYYLVLPQGHLVLHYDFSALMASMKKMIDTIEGSVKTQLSAKKRTRRSTGEPAKVNDLEAGMWC